MYFRGAIVDVRNKKGCTPLWLACHGGHLDVVQCLVRNGSDIDAQDNRRISCLMAGFRKGHVRVIRWVVKQVQQFPSDQEMTRYMLSIQNEPDLLKRCHQCAEYIKQAKDKQALEANKNASSLLEELDQEKSREESKKLAAQRRREKKKKKKMERKQQHTGSKEEDDDDDDNDNDDDEIQEVVDSGIDAYSQGSNSSMFGNKRRRRQFKHTDLNDQIANSSSNTGLKGNKENEKAVAAKNAANSSDNNKGKPCQVNSSMNVSTPQEEERIPRGANTVAPEPPTPAAVPLQSKASKKKKNKKKSDMSAEDLLTSGTSAMSISGSANKSKALEKAREADAANKDKLKSAQQKEALKERMKEVEEKLSQVSISTSNGTKNPPKKEKSKMEERKVVVKEKDEVHTKSSSARKSANMNVIGSMTSYKNVESLGPEPLMGISLNPSQLRKSGFDQENSNIFSSAINSSSSPTSNINNVLVNGGSMTGKGPVRSKEDGNGWKEVTRSCPSSRSKKVMVPSSVISRVIGRAGCNINAIREATGAHIEVEKQQKGQVQLERTIQIKGSADATKQAHSLITKLMNDPEVDIKKMFPVKSGSTVVSSGASVPPSRSTPTPTSGLCYTIFPTIGSSSGKTS